MGRRNGVCRAPELVHFFVLASWPGPGHIIEAAEMSQLMDRAKAAAERPTRKELVSENERLRAKLEAIERALKDRGLFSFEHIDGNISLNHR
jgi:hypothetical protein